MRHYFEQSEQIRTGFVSHIARDDKNQWNAGAIMLQQLALEGGHHTPDTEDDAWRSAMVLMETLSEKEMLDADLGLNGYSVPPLPRRWRARLCPDEYHRGMSLQR